MKKRTLTYLENNIKESILNDVKDIALYHSRRRKIKDAGYFSIPRHVFCYIDYLGLLLSVIRTQIGY